MGSNDTDEYVLFIDETGTANCSNSQNNTKSPYYILSGCAVRESDRAKLKQWAEHIKFKYWGDPDILFHSKEMGERSGNFEIFRDTTLYENFLSDLEAFLINHQFYMLYVLVPKKRARTWGWEEADVYKATSDMIIKNFLCFLMIQKAKGKIVVESASTEKDFYFHKSLSTYLNSGVTYTTEGVTDRIKAKEVKEMLTSISFVTKNNHDIEEQIADLLAYAGKFRYHGEKPGKYEALLLKILKHKMASGNQIQKILKPKFVKHLNDFQILPPKDQPPELKKD